MLVTFADGQKPQVLSSLNEANMSHKAFEINSSATYTVPKTGEDEIDLNEVFWTMTKSSFSQFLTELSSTVAASLQLTKNVLKERRKLEIAINGIYRNIKELLYNLERLNVEREISKQYQAEIDETKDISFETNEMAKEKNTGPS